MISEYKNNGATWIDVVSPTDVEVKSLMTRFNFDPEIADAIASPGIKTKTERHTDHAYLVLYFPIRKQSSSESDVHEIDFIIGKNYLITVHYEPFEALTIFSKLFEVDSILKHAQSDHGGYIFYHLLRHLYVSTYHELESISDALQHIEERMFAGEEKKVVRELLTLSRNLTHFRQTISAHEEALILFKTISIELFGTSFTRFANDMLVGYQKIFKETTAKREYLVELRETNDSLLNTKQNETMRVFTMLAFFTFPLSLIVGIFSLPTVYKPIIGSPYDFPIIISLLLVILLIMISYFNHKKWM